MTSLRQLATALLEERNALLVRWRAQVRSLPSARSLDLPALNDHIPGWLAELAASLSSAVEAPAGDAEASSPSAHGQQRFDDGFDIEEVVAEYNLLRDCVHELAERRGIALQGAACRFVNRAFDDAIGAAVKAFAEGQARELQRRRAEHLAFVAHDLRTPLSAVSYATSALEHRLEGRGDPELHRLVKILKRNTRQLDGLVGRVLDENTALMTELGVKVERRSFELWPFVQAMLLELEPVAARTGTRLVNAVPDDLELRADAGLVRRILQNLIANAIGYAPAGEVTIGARDPGGGEPVECWVSDDGEGIPASRLPRVFDLLETDPEREGHGLGLAIVKAFVEAHDGSVSAESVEGRGSTFRFTLPRAATLREDATA